MGFSKGSCSALKIVPFDCMIRKGGNFPFCADTPEKEKIIQAALIKKRESNLRLHIFISIKKVLQRKVYLVVPYTPQPEIT